MLATKLKHLENEPEIQETLAADENVMICCGRMGPMCIPVYQAMEQLQIRYSHVAFRDVDFDIPAANFIKKLTQCSLFMGLPFTVYFKKNRVVAATAGVQSKNQIAAVLDREFGKPS